MRLPRRRKGARFETYQDKTGAHRFRLVASNGEIVAASEAYTTRSNARRAAKAVKRLATDAYITDSVDGAR